MAVDGLGALALGSLFDRIGIWTMVLATIVSAAAAPLVFLGNFPLAVIGMACWGLGTGAQDSMMRATISRLSPQQRRATAFGIMNAVYGVAWFAGSVVLGVLCNLSLVVVVLTSAFLQAAALPSEGVGPRVRIRLAPAASLRTLGPPRDERPDWIHISIIETGVARSVCRRFSVGSL